MQTVAPVVADLGGFTVRRLLPRRVRRRVGAWCFLDLMGPLPVRGKVMDVPPHPHIGLQTVTWLLEGELLHKDSLDCEALARPGALNLMTSGRGIAHSEETPDGASGTLHGVQLWIALPEASRDVAPVFDHHAERPQVDVPGASATVIVGRLAGVEARARTFSPLVGAEIRLERAAEIPLDATFEHAVVPLDGDVEVDGAPVALENLGYLDPGRASVALRAPRVTRVLLLGGAPFDEPILMWWNFVARTTAEISQARDDWQAGRRFGEVSRYTAGPRLDAPPFVAKPVPANPMS